MSERESFLQIKVSRPSRPPTRAIWYRTCLVENRPDIKVGNLITFKDDEFQHTEWTIEEVSQPIPKYAVKRGWNNNI